MKINLGENLQAFATANEAFSKKINQGVNAENPVIYQVYADNAHNDRAIGFGGVFEVETLFETSSNNCIVGNFWLYQLCYGISNDDGLFPDRDMLLAEYDFVIEHEEGKEKEAFANAWQVVKEFVDTLSVKWTTASIISQKKKECK